MASWTPLQTLSGNQETLALSGTEKEKGGLLPCSADLAGDCRQWVSPVLSP